MFLEVLQGILNWLLPATLFVWYLINLTMWCFICKSHIKRDTFKNILGCIILYIKKIFYHFTLIWLLNGHYQPMSKPKVLVFPTSCSPLWIIRSASLPQLISDCESKNIVNDCKYSMLLSWPALKPAVTQWLYWALVKDMICCSLRTIRADKPTFVVALASPG